MTDVYVKPQEPILWSGSTLWHKPHQNEFIDTPYTKTHQDMGILYDPKKLARRPASLEKPKGEVAETRPPTNTRKMYSGGGGGMGGRGNVRYG